MSSRKSRKSRKSRECQETFLTSGSSGEQIQTLRRFGERIGVLWTAVSYAGVLLAVFNVWVQHPHFFVTIRGWIALTLVACYLAAYTMGMRWINGGMSQDHAETYWKKRFNTGVVLYPWRAVAVWASLLSLSCTLYALDHNFVWVIWIPFGISLSLLPMPRTLFLTVPTAVIAWGFYGALPTSLSPTDLLTFAGFVLGFTCYCIVIYLPLMLLRHRFQRERMFWALEQSHHELEQANRQLAEATVHERELAVLRERGRLARDMHDTLGHSLALMTVKLEAAQRLRGVDPARADHEVAATQAIARSALAELRAAITDLRASSSTRECLGNALARAAEESAARAGWQLACEIAPSFEQDNETLDDASYEALLRTGLESLANVERHAQAHIVRLTLARQDETLVLRIEDDGIGILATNPPQRIEARVPTAQPTEEATEDVREIVSPRGHFGITGMRERIGGTGGVFTISAGADGHGTRVEARLPASL